ncbi:MAG TPA: hypothetical protein VGF59_08050, partial [Bryobacteraceae bacterium]|jgi:hypothetical protein
MRQVPVGVFTPAASLLLTMHRPAIENQNISSETIRGHRWLKLRTGTAVNMPQKKSGDIAGWR